MKITIENEIFAKFPEYKEVVLVIKGLDNKANSDQSFQFLCNEMDTARVRFIGQKIENLSELTKWREAFEKVNIDPKKSNPSHEALLTRVLDKSDLPNISPIVNVVNAIQIKHLLPIGAHDSSKVEGDITVGENLSELPFPQRNGDEETNVPKEEIVYADSRNILTRKWCWRQGEKDLTSEDSSDIIIFMNSISHSSDELREIADETVGAINKFIGKCETKLAILDSETSVIDTDSMTGFTSTYQIDLDTVEISRDQSIIDQILEKATEEVLPSKDALEKLLKSGRRLRVYQGFDPTGETLHIGHTVMMRKLEAFRQLGHEVYFLIGDFTARIGDPDKKDARSQLTKEQVNENLKLYKEQAAAIVDIDNKDNPVKVVFNNDWLGEMKFEDVITLASKFTVQQMLKRSMFQERMKEDRPIYIHEFMYPMMQGWDSVNMKIDVELGGNDQLFNMLAGRHLVEIELGKEKFVISGKLLTTTDGAKMGKTTGNMIKLSDTPNDIYGKVMAFSDGAIIPGFELLTSASMEELSTITEEYGSGKVSPMDLKKKLAYRLTSELKGSEEADKAQSFFENVYQKQDFDTDIPTITTEEASLTIVDILTSVTQISGSRSDARRLIQQGAVKVNGNKIDSVDSQISLESEIVLKAGKSVIKIIRI